MDRIFLYGPPGSGKTSAGLHLAQDLDLPFLDLDEAIVRRSGRSIAEIFQTQGEDGFRSLETETLQSAITRFGGVVALGGGTLLVSENRRLVEEAGRIFLLDASPDILRDRIRQSDRTRPLLNGDSADLLSSLLSARAAHYGSFAGSIDTGGLTPAQVSWQIQTRMGWFYVRGMGSGYPVRVGKDLLRQAGSWAQEIGLGGPLALVFDENVGRHYSQSVETVFGMAGFAVVRASVPPGEATKSIDTARALWQIFLEGGLDRGSTVAALGGGMVSDLAGFSASTFMRGVPWIALPTSLLAMVDASLGGKTGLDLPHGKNLVGTFHPPTMVMADLRTLDTLPAAEIMAGMAEILKAGIIGDPVLFESSRRELSEIMASPGDLVRRAIAVKIQIVSEDPYELGRRAALNFGHTIGHAIESVSGYKLRHGEAISIGMVAETRLAEALKIAPPGLADEISGALSGIGLPVAIPAEIDRGELVTRMGSDKKKRGRGLRFALPEKIGQVRFGVEIKEAELKKFILKADTHPTGERIG